MHELIHIIGICPDSIAHYDLIDLLMINYQEFYIPVTKWQNQILKFGKYIFNSYI